MSRYPEVDLGMKREVGAWREAGCRVGGILAQRDIHGALGIVGTPKEGWGGWPSPWGFILVMRAVRWGRREDCRSPAGSDLGVRGELVT